MGYQADRDWFIAKMSAEGMPVRTIRQVLRLAATIDRLAVAKCNGDFPADHGSEWKTKVCPDCGCAWHPSAFRLRPRAARTIKAQRELSAADPIAAEKFDPRYCVDCATEAKLHAILPPGFTALTGGDPRGYTTKLIVPSGAHNTMGGREDGIGVPVRSR